MDSGFPLCIDRDKEETLPTSQKQNRRPSSASLLLASVLGPGSQA